MEFGRWMACLGVVVLAGCEKPRVSVVPEDVPDPVPVKALPSPAVPPPMANPVADQISSPAAAPVVAATPSAPRRCPEGVFYLVRKVSVTSDSGVMSAHPGTRVTFVREENGKIIVNNGEMDIPVMQDHLTNDLDEVDAILESATAESISRKKAIEARKAAIVQQGPASSVSTDSAISDSSVSDNNAVSGISLGETFNTPPPISDAADLRSRRELAKMQALQSQIDLLGAKIEADQNELARITGEMEDRRYYRMVFGRAPQNSVGIRESKFAIEQRIAALQREQRALVLQLSTLGQ